MTFMASYNQCMTQLMAKFHSNYCFFKAGFNFFAHLLPFLQLLIGEPTNIRTLALAG